MKLAVYACPRCRAWLSYDLLQHLRKVRLKVICRGVDLQLVPAQLQQAQGMALQPGSNRIWSSEHGPRGGDEINLIQRGLNYGWPLVTHGIDYDGSTISEHSEMKGMESPKHHWTPSIAVSGIDFYTGDQFPTWRNHLLVASLAAQQLRLLRIDGDRVIDDQVLVDAGSGRIRGVRSGPDGYPYSLIGSGVYRLQPEILPES